MANVKPEDLTKEFTFTRGALRNREKAYLVAMQDDLAEKKAPHGALFSWSAGKWGQLNVDWTIVSVCVARQPKEQMVAVGEDGEAQIIGSGETLLEKVRDGKIEAEKRGNLRCVNAVGGKAYVAGMDRQVY